MSGRTLYLAAAAAVLAAVLLLARITHTPAAVFTDPHSGIIVVDAGHGGIDGGAGVDGLLEKDINLAIAQRLNKALTRKGYTVVMTRDADISLDDQNQLSRSRHRRDLIARTEIINASRAELFVSIHENVSKKTSADGSIVLYGTRFPQSRAIALCIQRALNGILIDGEKRTIHDPRTADFYLLYNAEIPGVVVETAFLSNPRERKLLSEDGFQEKMARTIVLGIEQYFSQAGMASNDTPNW